MTLLAACNSGIDSQVTAACYAAVKSSRAERFFAKPARSIDAARRAFRRVLRWLR